MGLKDYNSKRDFNKTNEPKGLIKTTKLKRFVIQYHKARTTHYDFRLEFNGVLLSWAIPKGLSFDPKVKRLAIKVEDHPISYINFEGIIPKGNYGAGSVEIFDKGTYTPIKSFKEGLKQGVLKFALNGDKIKGCFSLIKTDEKNWLMIKIDDSFLDSIKKQKKINFEDFNVELATLSNTLPTEKGWLFEIKYDGYRMMSYLNNQKVKIKSRNNVDYSFKFKEICTSLLNLEQDSFIVDGEVVSFDKFGKSDFKLLQDNIKTNKNIYYVIFDILMLNGKDLKDLPLLERKNILEKLLNKSNKNLIYSSHIFDGEKSFNYALEHNLEGVIAKRSDSKYIGKRTKDWLKIKCYLRQEFLIIAYTTSSKNKDLSALLLGYYNNGELIYAGKVGTGFNEEQRKKLHLQFEKYKTNKCTLNKSIKEKNVVWLKLKFIAEVKYLELTKDGLLRHASFIGLRNDKIIKDVKLEIKNER